MFSLLIVHSLFAEEDIVLAKAGDFVVRKSDFERVMSYYPADRQKSLQENPQQKILLIKQLLQVKIVSDIAREEGFDKRPDVNEKLQYITNDALFKEYLTHVAVKAVSVSEDDMKQYYTLYKNKFSYPEQVRVRVIILKAPSAMPEEEKKKKKETAEEILAKLKKGDDFAELATLYSEDQRAAKKGGDMGYLQRDQLLKPVAEVAFSLKPSEFSGIVETTVGYQIIKVEDYREAGTKPFEEVKESINKQLEIEFSKTKAAEFLDRASKNAGLEIYADKITGETAKTK
jgi:parvulin-like peptidyl-prolyl isomerase